ncbi:uncharacterized protein EAF01_000821 [Botrytis porri]|uniref:uncharacterized protein n=1 Tax=Botrytis porri TaxID=87229 RepID=UPI001900DB0E|nr:uncharacterized protein EAF01_000821 [Botrytis porri]KAF7914415.1 hypothetical protein EAF01_000821 [Botrytis porri]
MADGEGVRFACLIATSSNLNNLLSLNPPQTDHTHTLDRPHDSRARTLLSAAPPRISTLTPKVESFSPHLTSLFLTASFPASRITQPLHPNISYILDSPFPRRNSSAATAKRSTENEPEMVIPVTNWEVEAGKWSACGIPVLISPRRFTEFVELRLSYFKLVACI